MHPTINLAIVGLERVITEQVGPGAVVLLIAETHAEAHIVLEQLAEALGDKLGKHYRAHGWERLELAAGQVVRAAHLGHELRGWQPDLVVVTEGARRNPDALNVIAPLLALGATLAVL